MLTNINMEPVKLHEKFDNVLYHHISAQVFIRDVSYCIQISIIA